MAGKADTGASLWRSVMSTLAPHQSHASVTWHSGGGNARLGKLVTLVKRITLIEDPSEILNTFVAGMRDIYGVRTYISLSTQGLGRGQFRVRRAWTDTGAELFPGGENDQSLPVRTGGVIQDLIDEPYPRIAMLSPLRNDPVFGDHLAQQRSAIAVPVFVGQDVTQWVVIMDQSPDAFSPEDIDNLLIRVNTLALLSENKRIARQLTEANAQIRDEMNRIAQIQRALIPQVLPTIPGVSFAARYLTYDTAGGDYYDVFPLSNKAGKPPGFDGSPFGFVMADASGHGPSAAVLVAMVHAMLYAYPADPTNPSEMLTHLNDHLVSKGLLGTFMTAFMGFYHPKSRLLKFANAGHPPAILKAGLGLTQELQTQDGFPLGIIGGSPYDNIEVQLEPEQTLLLYTDGIIDSQNRKGDAFGTRGLLKALQRCPGDPDCIISTGFDALVKHEAGLRPIDDQTMLVMQVS
jgi:phosphoserine phosphatase RsbU/P